MNFINILRQRLEESSSEAIELALNIISEVPLAVLSSKQLDTLVKLYNESSIEQALESDDFSQGGDLW